MQVPAGPEDAPKGEIEPSGKSGNLTLAEVNEVLEHGWKTVRDRSERELLLQLQGLLHTREVATLARPAPAQNCWCEQCDLVSQGVLRLRMNLCPECGSKRCPRAQSHDNACTHRT